MILFPAAVAFVLAKPIIKQAEGFCEKPYLCPAGKPTIGYGSTSYEDGTKVKLTDLGISTSRAEVMLTYGMMRVDVGLRPLLTRKPTAHQYAALLDIGYNIGLGVHDGKKGDIADSTLIALFNAGDFHGCANQFGLWVHAHVDGKVVVLDGLVDRRATDKALFLTPDK